ncbi:MAG TPA: hypothetical protein VGD80_41425 [Kofleriaceae bacterium]
MMARWRARQLGWPAAESRRAAIVVVIASVAGCSESRYDHLADRAEEVRQLQFVDDVPTRTLTPEQFRDEASQDVDERSDAELRDYADTYGRLGFFDVNLDLRPIFVQSRIDATGAFYSASQKRITFVGAPEDGTVVHEYVHALQDQHFDLRSYDDGARTTDAFLARRAVVEGDAVLAAARFLIEEKGGGLDTIDYTAYFNGWVQYSNDYLNGSPYPLIFRAYTSFVYAYGLMYSATNLFGTSPLVRRPGPPPHSWKRQDELFTLRAPATTAQILAMAVDSAPVGISDVPAALAADLSYIASDNLGAWYTYLLFRPLTFPPSLRDFDGDQVLFARVTATGAVGVLWASAWHSESAAMSAAEGLRMLHFATEEPVVVERRLQRVVLARNFPPSLTPALVDAAFTGTAAARRSGPLPLHARETKLR